MKTRIPALEDRIKRFRHRLASRERMAIADILRSYGLPFFYKHPTLVNENRQQTIEYIDFFLPAYNGLAIDYIVEAKSKIYLHKGQMYAQNQMQAASAARRGSYDRSWQSRLYKKRERTYHRRPVYRSSGSY